MTRTLILCLACLCLGVAAGYYLTGGREAATAVEARELAAAGPATGRDSGVAASPAQPLQGDAAATGATPPSPPDAASQAAEARPGDSGAAAQDGTLHPPTDAGPGPRPRSTARCPDALLDERGALVAAGDPFLEERMQWLLADYRVPEGAVVVLEPASGTLLAAAGYVDEDQRAARELALEPRFLAASIFKIVSGAALLERGLTPASTVIYSGGYRSVRVDELKDVPARDTASADFAEALARSLNVPFAKWADRLLDARRLSAAARRFGFEVPLSDGGRCWGSADIPADRLAFARTAAGFGDVRLSAWHAAMIAAVVANRGLLPSALVPAGQPPKRILEAAHAEQLAAMMQKTVTEGTARRLFYENGRYQLGELSAAGKTGSLVEGSGDDWREATWFVGFAPVDAPKVAVATLLQNTPHWRIRAAYVGREALRTALLRTSPYRPTQDRVSRRAAAKRKR